MRKTNINFLTHRTTSYWKHTYWVLTFKVTFWFSSQAVFLGIPEPDSQESMDSVSYTELGAQEVILCIYLGL